MKYILCPQLVNLKTATSAVKKKFRFPAQDPGENDVTDTRSDLQKINDIIRVWSQVLTPAEQLLWDEIAERNLSHDISLSGIRTPKTLIDDEIKKYRNLNATKQKQLLQSLSKAPSEIVTPLSSDQPVTTSQDDTLSIMPGEFKVHETFASNFCTIPTNLACSTQSCEHADPAAIEQLLEECHQEVNKIRNCSRPKKLWHIFRDNKQLLFKFLYVLKKKYSLSARFRSIYRRFSKINNLPSRLIKKITNALQTRNLIDSSWLNKPSVDVEVNYANKAPILQICLNSYSTSAILDTGSTFSLVPFSIWQKLNIHKNQLDQSVQFNINSASHNNPDAVLGRLHLNINIRDKHGVEQTILQNCLILRQHLDLAFVLLGNDFL